MVRYRPERFKTRFKNVKFNLHLKILWIFLTIPRVVKRIKWSFQLPNTNWPRKYRFADRPSHWGGIIPIYQLSLPLFLLISHKNNERIIYIRSWAKPWQASTNSFWSSIIFIYRLDMYENSLRYLFNLSLRYVSSSKSEMIKYSNVQQHPKISCILSYVR